MLEGTSGGASCTTAPSRASCEVRPGCSGLCPARFHNPPRMEPAQPPRAGPACPHGKGFSAWPEALSFQSCCRALSTPAVKGPAASSPSPPLGLRGVCEVPPKPSLPRLDQPQPLLRGQAPAPSTAGVTSRRVIGVFLHQGTKLLVPRCALTASAGHRGPASSSSLCSCCGSPRCCCLPLLPAPAQLAGPVRVCICTLVFHIS